MQISGLFHCIGMKIRRKCHEIHVCMQLFCRKSHIGLRTWFLWENNDQNLKFMCRMVLEWREREHGDVKEAIQAGLMAQKTLPACRLYKFWCLGSYRRLHSNVLPSWYIEVWDSNIDKHDSDSRAKKHNIGIRKDRFGITPLGLNATDVLCSRVYAAYNIWLEYYTVEQHETIAQWLQDGQSAKIWVR